MDKYELKRNIEALKYDLRHLEQLLEQEDNELPTITNVKVGQYYESADGRTAPLVVLSGYKWYTDKIWYFGDCGTPLQPYSTTFDSNGSVFGTKQEIIDYLNKHSMVLKGNVKSTIEML